MRSLRFTLVSLTVLVAIMATLPLQALAQDPEFLVSLDDPMAAFLESRAYAAKVGATAEFRKMEWVAADPASNKLYLSMSEINNTMSDGEGDIQLEQNDCGIVYEADLDADYNISSLKPLIVGGPYDETDADYPCAVDNIANPDALFVAPNGDLWIGEDSGEHVNNFIWKWDGENLTRYASMPVGAEATGVLITPSNDIIFSVQHPSAMSIYPYNRASLVVINGFKADEAFTDLAVPEGDAKHTLTVAAGEPQVLARVGELIPNDIRGERWGQVNKADGTFDFSCNQPDGNIWLPTNEAGSEGYLYTNYECQPGNMGKLYMRAGAEGWEVLEGENVDFSGVMGTWNNCGTSHTPWGTGLSAEEYEPVATVADWQKNVSNMNNYIGGQPNPYDYGWLVEVFPDPRGNSLESQVVKQYALGRFSHEMGITMPDEKTIYHGDDGTGVVLFKSVLDEAGDMSVATLYAAKVTQQDDGSLNLEWIELGTSNNDDIYEAIRAVPLQ
jgi:secreted PhoX family phosphatase